MKLPTSTAILAVIVLGDERLQAAYQRGRSASGPHVTEAEWEQLACHEIGAADRQRLLAHILACAECTGIHRSLLTLEREAAAFDPNVAAMAKPPAPARAWLYAAGLAAAAVFAFVVVDVRTPAPLDTGNDVTRSRSALSTISVSTPVEKGVLVDRRIAWQRVNDAESYEVLINSQDGAPVWSTIVTGTDATIPASTALPAGSYYAQIKALRQDAAIGSSALIPFRVE